MKTGGRLRGVYEKGFSVGFRELGSQASGSLEIQEFGGLGFWLEVSVALVFSGSRWLQIDG